MLYNKLSCLSAAFTCNADVITLHDLTAWFEIEHDVTISTVAQMGLDVYAIFSFVTDMLARYMLSSYVRLSVCPSVTSRYCIETTGRIKLVFGVGASFDTNTLL